MNEIYAAERGEYRAALSSLSEMQWAASRHDYDGLGMTGEREDAHDAND